MTRKRSKAELKVRKIDMLVNVLIGVGLFLITVYVLFKSQMQQLGILRSFGYLTLFFLVLLFVSYGLRLKYGNKKDF